MDATLEVILICRLKIWNSTDLLRSSQVIIIIKIVIIAAKIIRNKIIRFAN